MHFFSKFLFTRNLTPQQIQFVQQIHSYMLEIMLHSYVNFKFYFHIWSFCTCTHVNRWSATTECQLQFNK